MWGQVDGMISEIEKDKEFSIRHNETIPLKPKQAVNSTLPAGGQDQMFKSVFTSLKTMRDDPKTSSARMMKVVPTVKQQVRSKLQKAFQEAESATVLNQIYSENKAKKDGKSVSQGSKPNATAESPAANDNTDKK